MTKAQFAANIVLFIPLFILNFFAYGIDGCGRMIQEMNKYSKKYLKKQG